MHKHAITRYRLQYRGTLYRPARDVALRPLQLAYTQSVFLHVHISCPHRALVLIISCTLPTDGLGLQFRSLESV